MLLSLYPFFLYRLPPPLSLRIFLFVFPGDGDQSDFVAEVPGTPGQVVHDIWSQGADFIPSIISPFSAACYFGESDVVAKMLADVAGDKDSMIRLLEHRVSLLRYTPLLSCISGARAKADPLLAANSGYTSAQRSRADHAGTRFILFVCPLVSSLTLFMFGSQA